MINKIITVAACLLFFFFVTGCGNSEPITEEADLMKIEVVNKTEEIIISFAVFFGTGLEEWGEDLMGEEIIGPGDTMVFELPPGAYDLSLLTYELYVVHGAWNINEDTRIEIGGEGKTPILIENNSESDIALFYLSPSESDDWGEDWLGDVGYIPSQTGRRFFFVEVGVYDFLAIDLDGQTVLEVYELSIEEPRTFTID